MYQPTRISTMRQHSITTLILLLLTPMGCEGIGPDPKINGIRVWCDGTGAGTEEEDQLGFWYRNLYCDGSVGACYHKKPKFQLCIDPNAEIGDTGNFDDEDWVNDPASLDYIRGQCIKECRNTNAPMAEAAGKPEKCYDDAYPYLILNGDGLPTPDNGHAITNPGHLECSLSENSNLQPRPNPSDITVITSGTSPQWPSNSDYIELVCDNYQDCSEEFTAPILGSLLYEDDNGDWGDNMGRADYLATTGNDTKTELTLSIHNSVSGLSSETNDAEGRIEYSAPDCGEVECPFYISNMTLSNDLDHWSLRSDAVNANVDVTHVWARLRRPVLGIWNTSSGEIYIGEGMMELYIEADVGVGSADPATASFFVVNRADIFGEMGLGGSVSFLSLSADDGNTLAMEADLDYDRLTDGPPTADIGFADSTTIHAPTNSGLPITSINDRSSDPDNDLGYKLWIVDGVERLNNYVIPTGTHTLRLEVEDERAAFDVDQQTLTIVYP
jgi:hypothetical protein